MIHPVKPPKQISWKIIYHEYKGYEKKAIEFLSREVGKYLIRQEGVYTLYVLPCEKEDVAAITENAIVVALYQDSPTVRKCVKEEELDGKDYVIKVVVNPDNENCRIVLITARTGINLMYGAQAFADNYPVQRAVGHGGLKIPQWRYDYLMPEYTLSETAKIATRGAWTWAHPINDYRAYIRNMARLRINQITLWNDYMPLNAKEVVDYAHEYGIKVIWGYSWGWNENGTLKDITEEFLEKLKQTALRSYEENYKDTNCDGIYFQSFTEVQDEKIGDKLIAEVVTDFVNDTAAEFFKRYHDMKIQFGLHATSVKNHLDILAKVDKRVEIVWEDCGTFPYGYTPIVRDEQAYEETLEFTRKIVNLRPGAPVGLILKGFMTVNWEMFEHQKGPYIMGDNSTAIQKADQELRKPIWKMFESEWLQYGGYALRLVQEVFKMTNGNVNISMVCEDGGGTIPLPCALFAEMVFDPQQEYGELMRKVSYRQAIIENA